MWPNLHGIAGDATPAAIPAGHIRTLIPEQRSAKMPQPVEEGTGGQLVYGGRGRSGGHVSMVSSANQEFSIMASEIERKFLVQGDGWRAGARQRLCQGYLNRDKERTVRVRIAGDEAFLTIKGVTRGATRAEFEYEIPMRDAEQLLELSDGPILEKNRHVLVYEGSRWEVDEFVGENAGLVIAEIELQSEDQPFSRPPWLGREVTNDTRYYNSNLAGHPYSAWRNDAITG
jgi:CYTH domain-containing protein